MLLRYATAALLVALTVVPAEAQQTITAREAALSEVPSADGDAWVETHIVAGDAEAQRRMTEALLAGGARSAGLTILTPGDDPEGDNIGEAAFTPDGGRLLLANGYTDNLTVLDAATLEVLANVDVCNFPTNVAASASVAVVGCLEGLSLVDLDTYTATEVAGFGEVGAAEIMPDGMRAVVADLDAQSGRIIDLATGATDVSLATLPTSSVGFEFLFPTTRSRVEYSKVLIADGGATLIVPRFDEEGVNGGLLFVDAATGNFEDITVGVNAVELVLSEDGAFVVAADRFEDRLIVRVDAAERAVDTTYVLPEGVRGNGLGDFTANADGSKVLCAFAPVGGGTIQNYVIDLDAGTEQNLGTTALIHWHAPLAGGRYVAGSGASGTAVFDFQTDAVTQIVGPDVWAWGGAVTPDGARFASWTIVEQERAFTYDIADGTASLLGEQVSGAPAEADSPIQLSVYPDGDRALVTNRKSYNLSVLDLETITEVEIIDVPNGVEPRRAVVLQDGERAVVGNRQLPSSWQFQLLDLETGDLLDAVSLQALPEARGVDGGVFALNLSDELFFFDTSGDELDLVEGPSTFIVDAWATPDDGALFFAMDEAAGLVRFYDGSTGLSVAEFSVPQPVSVAFTPGGALAFALSGTGEVFRYAVDGATVTADRSFSCVCSNPVYVAANDETVGVAAEDGVLLFRVVTGASEGSVSAGGTVSWLAVRPNGGIIAELTLSGGASGLYLDGTVETLPRGTFNPEYAREADLALLPLPGPDAVAIGTPVAVSNEAGPGTVSPLTLTAAPNPTRGTAAVRVAWAEGASPQGGRLEVFDVLGRRVLAFDLDEHRSAPGRAAVELAGRLPSGVYVLRASVGRHEQSLRLTVVE
ncbi:MAG: hypothetical protein AAGI91_08400 [Bacteroidota bacterium]